MQRAAQSRTTDLHLALKVEHGLVIYDLCSLVGLDHARYARKSHLLIHHD